MLAWGMAIGLGLSSLAGCGATGGPGRNGAAERQQAAARALLHAPGQVSIFVQPEAGTAPVVGAIDGAKRSVWLQIYMLTDVAVIEALGRAAERGLDVRVLLEEKPYNPGNPNSALSTNQKVATNLETQGCKVSWTNPQFNFTHAKGMLVDGQVAYVLTYNLTKAATETNREFGVINRAMSDVGELRRIFLADWNRQPYQPLDPDLVVSPDNARMRILALMAGAERELLVGVEVISDPEVMAMLAYKRGLGVDVRVLVGSVKKITANLAPANQLAAAGVPTRSQGRPYLHAKYIIADGEAAYVGSINFSTNSLDENRELGLILQEPEVMSTLRKTWDIDWPKADPVIAEGPPPAPIVPIIPAPTAQGNRTPFGLL